MEKGPMTEDRFPKGSSGRVLSLFYLNKGGQNGSIPDVCGY
jgi:hypothetical protein